MYKKIILFFLPVFFLLFFLPNVNATYYCAGTSLCLQYNQTYIVEDDYWSLNYAGIDTNDTTNTYPDYFFLWRHSAYSSDQGDIMVYNSTWDHIDDITFDSEVYNYAGCWYNNSGTEELTGGDILVGNDYFNYWTINGTYLTRVNLNEAEWSGVDWSALMPEYFIFQDAGHDQIDIRNATDLSLYAYCQLSWDVYTSGIKGSNTNENYVYMIDRQNRRIYAYDLSSCTSLGYLDFSTFEPSSTTLWEIFDLVTNYDESKMWVSERFKNGTTYYTKIFEFELNVTHTLSTIVLSVPIEGQIFSEDNIVIEGVLGAYYDGDLNCTIDGVNFYSASYTTGLYDLDIPSGTLTAGDHNVTCIFTDEDDYEFSSGTINFVIGSGVTLDIGGQTGNYIADLFGFEDDGFSTGSAKGMFLISIIISLLVGAVITGFIASKGDGAGAGMAFIIVFLAMIMMFAFVGWFPAWIFFILLILSILITAGFLYSKMTGG